MNIEAKDFELRMTYDELWSTACDVKNALEYTLKTHWVNHQSSWEENEKGRMYRLRTFYNALGRQDMYQDIIPSAKRIFEEFNQKRQVSKPPQLTENK